MNFQTELLPVLGACFSKEKAIRKTAQTTLNLAKLLPGFVPYLLKVSVELEDDQIDVAQSAAIQLKNAILDHWNSPIIDIPAPMNVQKKEDIFVVSNEDKDFIRNNVIEAIMKKKTSKLIYKQLLQAFKYMTSEDFKEQCDPLIVNQIVEILNSDDLRNVEMGVKLIRKLIKNYEYRSQQKRAPMEQLCAAFFPKIEEILEQALQSQSEESFHFIHTCVKIFFTITHVEIPRFLFEDELERMNNWLKLHFMIISGIKSPELPITQDPQEYEDRQELEIFKMKGTALRSVFTLFQFYGSKKNPRDTQNYKKFQQLLMKEHLHPFLNEAYKIILQTGQVFTPAKQLNYSIKLFINLWTNEESKPMIKKELDNIIYEPALRITYLTPKDMELWDENQVEFIRRHQDFREALFFARNSMIDFIVLAIKPVVLSRKGKGLKQKVTHNSEMLEKYLKFCVSTLTQYNEHKGGSSDSTQDFRIRESVLLVVGHLSEQVAKIKEFQNNMGTFLKEYVLDGLKSDVGLIRWRCAWMFERYRNIPWKKIENSEELLQEIVKGLLELLVSDPNLAIRVQAATSLQPYFKHQRAMELVHMHFDKVLNSYIELMRQIDNDSLVYSLEGFVRQSGEAIIPHALVLAEQMSKTFMKYARSDEEDDDEDFRSIQASDDWDSAVGCLDGLKQILTTCRNRPDIIAQIEPFILPVIGYGLTPIGMEISDQALDLLSLIMRYGQKINPKVWLMYPVLCEMAVGVPNVQDQTIREIDEKEGGWGFEFFPNMMLAFQNFIVKEPEAFINDDARIDLLLSTCQKVMKVSTLKDNEEVEYIVVGQLLITLLECLKGKIDHKIPPILELVIKQLERDHKESEKSVRSILLQVVSMALYYNAQLVLSLLSQQEGLVEKVFQELHKFLSQFKLRFELRRSLFGLTSVLISQQLPPIFQKNYSSLFEAAAGVAIKAAKLQTKKRKEQSGKEEDHKKVKGEIGNQDELRAAVEKMKELGDQMSEDQEDYEDEEEEDHKSESDDVFQFIDDQDDEEMLDVDEYYKSRGGAHILYQSPLDDFNEVLEFQNAVQLIPEERRAGIQLSPEVQAELKAVFEAVAK